MEEQPKPVIISPEFKDKNVIQFMRDAAALAKRQDVRSAFILTITADGHVDWSHVCESEHHALLAFVSLDDAKAELKAEIFNENAVD